MTPIIVWSSPRPADALLAVHLLRERSISSAATNLQIKVYLRWHAINRKTFNYILN